eukprot:1185315-Prorocentrum_minimum.AAC.2
MSQEADKYMNHIPPKCSKIQQSFGHLFINVRMSMMPQGRDPDEEVEKAKADGSLYHIDNWEEHKARYNITE